MDWTAIWAQIDARIERAVGRIRLATRAVVAVADPSTGLSGLAMELLAGELLDGVELFQHFGFRSVPAPGAEAIVLQVGGRGGHYVVIATGDRTTAPAGLVVGDSCIYSATGSKVVVKMDGSVEISTPAGGSISMDPLGAISLNAGVQGVARMGDSVSFVAVCPSTGTPHIGGAIASGSATVKAGG